MQISPSEKLTYRQNYGLTQGKVTSIAFKNDIVAKRHGRNDTVSNPHLEMLIDDLSHEGGQRASVVIGQVEYMLGDRCVQVMVPQVSRWIVGVANSRATGVHPIPVLQAPGIISRPSLFSGFEVFSRVVPEDFQVRQKQSPWRQLPQSGDYLKQLNDIVNSPEFGFAGLCNAQNSPGFPNHFCVMTLEYMQGAVRFDPYSLETNYRVILPQHRISVEAYFTGDRVYKIEDQMEMTVPLVSFSDADLFDLAKL